MNNTELKNDAAEETVQNTGKNLLTEKTLKDFAGALSSEEPTPGGGGAAALEGVLGASLGAMVCALTIGKKKYESEQSLATEANKNLLAIKDEYLELINKDALAFGGVSACFSMPKNTDEEKKARKDATQQALKNAAEAPFEMLKASLKAMKEVSKLLGHSNENVASDLGCSAVSLKACASSAWLNVCINLRSIDDEGFVKKYRDEGESILSEVIKLSDDIYAKVKEGISQSESVPHGGKSSSSF